LPYFNERNLLNGFLKKKSDFRKIHPVGAELFHAVKQTDMTKLIVAFQSFAKAPKKESVRTQNALTTPPTTF
jgi:hypothetical protein